jgi:hypothetical protein
VYTCTAAWSAAHQMCGISRGKAPVPEFDVGVVALYNRHGRSDAAVDAKAAAASAAVHIQVCMLSKSCLAGGADYWLLTQQQQQQQQQRQQWIRQQQRQQRAEQEQCCSSDADSSTGPLLQDASTQTPTLHPRPLCQSLG